MRKYESNSSSLFDESQLQERVEVTDILLNDLRRLKELSNLTIRRTAVLNRLRETNDKIKPLTESPENYILRNMVINKFVDSEAFKSLECEISDKMISLATSKLQRIYHQPPE